MKMHYYKRIGYFDTVADLKHLAGCNDAEKIVEWWNNGNGTFTEDSSDDFFLEREEDDDILTTKDKTYAVVNQVRLCSTADFETDNENEKCDVSVSIYKLVEY